MVDDFFNFFDSVLVNYLFSHDLHSLHFWNLNLNLNDLFDSLRYFDNLFNNLNDRDWLLNLNFNDFWNGFHMVDNLSGVSVLN